MNREARFQHKGEFYLVVLLFVFSMIILIGALGFPHLARIAPLLVGAVGLLLITMDILQMLIPKFGVQFRSLKGGELFTTSKVEEIKRERDILTGKEETARPMSVLKTLLWFICGFVIFYLFGYLLFSILFLFLFLKFYSRISLLRSLTITGGTALLLWMSFTLFLKVDILAGSALFALF